MPGSTASGAVVIYAFLDCELDEERCELRFGGQPVDLQPKVLSLLLHLVRQRERVVTRDELFAELWPDVVVTEDALFHTLMKARSAVGDSGLRQRVIATVPRVGYRFVAAVEERSPALARAVSTAPVADPVVPAGPPLVGRRGELELLDEAFESARTGTGRIVLILGEAGIGKSRLAREVAERARSRGAEVYEASSWQGAGAPPLWLWVQILRAAAGARSAEALSRTMGEGAGEIQRLVPAVGERLGCETPPVADGGDESRFRLMDAISRFLVAASRERPLVLMLEDLQWAPAATLQVLAFLASALASARILVVATCRDTEIPRDHPLLETVQECERHDVLQRLTLTGIGVDEIIELVEHTAGFHPASALAGALRAATGGNPLFVKEIVKLAADESERGQEVAARLESRLGEIPAGVRRVLERRLALLSPEGRTMIECAAVIGPEVSFPLLAQVCELPREDLLAALDEAIDARLLETRDHGEPGHRFAHALVRDAAVAGIPGTARVRLHQRVAGALERLHAGRRQSVIAELAHHYFEAAPLLRGTEAVDYAKAAGDLASAALSHDEAAAHYERALQALDLVPGAGREAQRRAELGVCLGYAHHNAGHYVRAREVLHQAAVLAAECGDTQLLVLAALGYGEIVLGRISDPELVGMLERALAALEDRDSFVAVWLCVMLSSHLTNDPARRGDAERLIDTASETAKRMGDARALRYVLCGRAAFLRLDPRGRPEERRRLLDEAERLAREAPDGTADAVGRYQLYGALLELGEASSAADAAGRTASAVARTRSRYWGFFEVGCRISRLFLEGRFDEVEVLARESFSASDTPRIGYREMLAAVIAFVRLEQGRMSELVPVLDRLVEERPILALARAGRALALLDSGRTEASRADFELLAVEGFARVVGTESWIVALTILSEVCIGLEDEDRALELETLLAPRAPHCVILTNGMYCHGPVALRLAALASMRRDWALADQRLGLAEERAEALGSPVWRAHALAERARFHARRGRSGDPARAAAAAREARAIGERLGMVRLLRTLPVPSQRAD